MGDARRAKSCLPSSNHRLGNGDGEKEVGFADIVVVKKIHHVGAEVIDIEYPSAQRDGHTELVFFIAFPMESDESKIAGLCKSQQRPRSRYKGRRLIVVAVKSAEGPVETRYVEGDAEARTDRVLRDSAREVRGPHTRGQRKPGYGLEFVVNKERFQAAGGVLGIGKGSPAGVVEHSEQFIILLIETVHTHLQIILRNVCTETNLTSAIA